MSWAVKLAVDTLETLFLAGIAGTVLVILLSAVEDVETIRSPSRQD